MRTNWIEVSKQNHIPFRICLLHIHHDLFNHALGLTVRIGALSLRAFLCNRNHCRIAVNRRRGRENNIFAAMLAHHIQQNKRTGDIVFIIFQWFLYRFTDCLESCKMNAAIKCVVFHHLCQAFSVTDVYLIERNRFAGDFGYTLQGFFRSIAQIVHNNDIMSRFLQFNDCVAANISGTAGNQNIHCTFSFFKQFA